MPYTYIHIRSIHEAIRAGIRWKVRLEYVGYNGENQSGRSAKFWELTCEGNSIRRNWGKIGSTGRSNPPAIDVYEAVDKAYEKVNDGYKYSSLTDHSWAPAAKPTPAPVPPKVELVGPLNNIVTVVPAADGTYAALDENENLVMSMPASGVRKLFSLSPWVRSNSMGISDEDIAA